MAPKLRQMSFYAVGIMLILSSLMKAVDLVSFSAKIGEYVYALGFKFSEGIYDIAAIVVVFIELSLGITIIRGVYTRAIYLFTVVFIGCFTMLTLYVALDDNVSECGCFGNILELTMWQSFLKNVVFLFLVIISYDKTRFLEKVYVKQLIIMYVVSLFFCLSNIIAQPLFEIKAYGVGDCIDNIFEIESIDGVGLEMGSYNGIVRNFSEADYQQIESIKKVLYDLKGTTNELPMILTASPLSVVKDLEMDVVIGRCDNHDLSNIISGNVGIMTISNNIITSKWQKDNLGLRRWPKIVDNKIYDCIWIRILQWTMWIIIGIVIINSIVQNDNKNETAENR